jgi:DNA-binding transcriptional ArsR family regulator
MQLNSYRYFGSPPSPEQLSDETLDAVFSALAESTRRKILARLAEGEASVAELAEPFKLSQPAVSKHLKVLENAGLVSHARDAQRRPRKLEAARLEEATGWLDNYRRFWEARYQRLDALLDEMVAREKRPRRVTRNPKTDPGDSA